MWGGAFLEDAGRRSRVLVGQVLESARGLGLLPAVARLELGQGAGDLVGC